MYVVLFTSFLAFLLTYLESKRKIEGGMKWGFILLAFLGCIHYDYGNDYQSYFLIYKNITKYPFDLGAVISGESFKEQSWAFLCYLFKNFGGFFMLVAFLNIVQCILVYTTIKRYVAKPWWPFSVFIFAFSSNLYILGFSMMRQYLVMVIFFACWPLIEKKKTLLALLVLFLCTTIHTSAMLLLPFAFMSYASIQRSKLWAWGLVLLFLAVWFAGSFINNIFASFMSTDQFGAYEHYGDTNDKISFGIGYLVELIPFILSIRYLMDDKISKSRSDKGIVYISLISFLVMPFATIIPLITRISFYFIIYQIIAIPLVYSQIANWKIRYAAIFIFVFMTLYTTYGFFYSPVWIEKYSTFKTIFPEIF